MKKLATCVVAITGFIGTSAFAADMGVPTAPPPAPVWNWTGWYAGVNVGASFGNVKTDFDHAGGTVVINGVSRTSSGFSESNTEYPDGFMGGGQIGYNWQYSPLIVVGVEADFQGAVEKDHNTLTHPFEHQPDGFLVTGTVVTDYSTQIDWFGTVRARIGYVWGNGQVMSYLTGGLAYGEVKINGTSTDSGSVCPGTSCTTLSTPFSSNRAIGHSDVNIGWVAGYGTEGRLATPGWTWRVESYYMDLGHIDDTDAPALTVTGASTGQVTSHTHFTDGILRGGLNYKFY
jgi:outer membrane immunogenic protein